MRVVMDGAFFRLPPSGIGEYVRQLVAALRRTEPALDLRIVEPAWDHRGTVSQRSLGSDRRVQRARWELFDVSRAAASARPDLLHIPAFGGPFHVGVPYVVTIHDAIPFTIPAYRSSRAMRAHLALLRRNVERAAAVIAPSVSAAREIERAFGWSDGRVRPVLSAAGPEYVPAPNRDQIEPRLRALGITVRYVFNVGGLDVRKNLPLLIEAFARLLPSLEEPVQLVIAGAAHSDNPTVFPPLEPVIARHGLGGKVLLTGRVDEATKLMLYQGAACYASPSWAEGFGLTALEAMACGVPTIAANRTSFPEVMGDAGLLVEVDADALALAMKLVLSNSATAASMRASGLARAATFSWDRTARETYAVYQSVLGGS